MILEIVKKGFDKVSELSSIICTFYEDIDAAVEAIADSSVATTIDNDTVSSESEKSSEELTSINVRIEELLRSDGGNWWKDDSKRAAFRKLSLDRDRIMQKLINESEQNSGTGRVKKTDTVLQKRRDLKAKVARAKSLVVFAGPYWCQIPAITTYFDKVVSEVNTVILSHSAEDAVGLLDGRTGAMVFDPVDMLEDLVDSAKLQHKVRWYIPEELCDWRMIPRLCSHYENRVRRIGNGEKRFGEFFHSGSLFSITRLSEKCKAALSGSGF